MFEEVNNTIFYKQWTELLLNLDKVDWMCVTPYETHSTYPIIYAHTHAYAMHK